MLEEAGLRWVRSEGRLARSDPDSGGGVDELGDVLNLRHPLGLSHNSTGLNMPVLVVVLVAVRLGGSSCDKQSRGNSEGLHDELRKNAVSFEEKQVR